jgi:hypothetical protein
MSPNGRFCCRTRNCSPSSAFAGGSLCISSDHSSSGYQALGCRREPRLGAGRLPGAGFLDLDLLDVRSTGQKVVNSLVCGCFSSLRLALMRGVPFCAFLLWLNFRKSIADGGYSGRNGRFLSYPFDLWKKRFLCFCGPLCPRRFLGF